MQSPAEALFAEYRCMIAEAKIQGVNTRQTRASISLSLPRLVKTASDCSKNRLDLL
jgi:hypothetical protein